jgi:hypothetical protein
MHARVHGTAAVSGGGLTILPWSSLRKKNLTRSFEKELLHGKYGRKTHEKPIIDRAVYPSHDLASIEVSAWQG